MCLLRSLRACSSRRVAFDRTSVCRTPSSRARCYTSRRSPANKRKRGSRPGTTRRPKASKKVGTNHGIARKFPAGTTAWRRSIDNRFGPCQH
jgi:hypothetical protein